MAIYHQILPPTTGCHQPHSELTNENPALRILRQSETWTKNYPLRAGVSAMGFGGINTHIVLEGIPSKNVTPKIPTLSSAQDAEIILLGATDRENLQQQIQHLLTITPRLSRAEVTDLAAQLAKTLDHSQVRAAIVASNPQELTNRLEILQSWLEKGLNNQLDIPSGIYLGTSIIPPRIGFLFPGQASPTHITGGAWCRNFPWVQELYQRANLPQVKNTIDTAIAQPAIVTASIAGFQTLEKLGIKGAIAVGHSLGELTALSWGGAFDEAALLRISKARGKAMGELSNPSGTMASIKGDRSAVTALINGDNVAIAGLNSPRQTVISGEINAIATIIDRARTQGIKATLLPVSHAFHSPLVAQATLPFATHLANEEFQPLQRTVISTVTGTIVPPDEDLRSLLTTQITSPVKFIDGVTQASPHVDLWIEVGPGEVLSGLVGDFVNTPIIPIDAGGLSFKGLLNAIGAAFVLGTPINRQSLFSHRFTKPFNLNWQPKFFVNPCEKNREIGIISQYHSPTIKLTSPPAPLLQGEGSKTSSTPFDTAFASKGGLAEANANLTPPFPGKEGGLGGLGLSSPTTNSPLEIVRQLVAERSELPVSAIKDNNRLLSDLHLNSITVGQLVGEAAKRLGLSPPIAPTDYANATITEVVQALEELVTTGSSISIDESKQVPSGVDAWIRTFTVELVEKPLPHCQAKSGVSQFDKNLNYTLTPPFNKGGWGGDNCGDKQVSLPKQDLPAKSTLSNWKGWQIFAPSDYPLAKPLQEAFDNWDGGSGVIVCLPPQPDESHLSLLLDSAKVVITDKEVTHFILVQHGVGGAGFARTLHLESPNITTCIVNLPGVYGDFVKAEKVPDLIGVSHRQDACATDDEFIKMGWIDVPLCKDISENIFIEWVLAEAKAAVGYVESDYDISGVRREPILRLLPNSTPPTPPYQGGKISIQNLTSTDLLLVTGGGKGIAAESAISLAKETGIRLALLGRSHPNNDTELAANLERMAGLGIQFKYIAADVTNSSAVRGAIAEFEAELGTITAILHGAGTNVPQLLTSLDETAIKRTLAPKVQGLHNILAAVNPYHLKLLVAFGSIIARTGLRGEADYALANEWLGNITESFGIKYPNCRCVTIDWSVWSGVGMGERLGRVDALMQQGITPISPDMGISIFRNIIAQCLNKHKNQIEKALTPDSIIVTGRFGDVPTLKLPKPELPFLRFLEKPRVYYPGVELVVDAELSTDTDPYLNDHIYKGDRIFPGVMGLEAMAQVAMALLETSEIPVFEDIKFNHPVVVSETSPLKIRIAALVRETGKVEIVLRSEQTGFAIDHFRTTCM
ncbi:SDR family NAD(P)-dependent oxidoreductase, partial [Symplocastrum sp. BBK-W-15]|nr:SDR family NAD(P)-dependent oxidoreductase [Limnofasciculus baicalensis BBK-W-15]